jgi:hypothetical protein
MPLTILSPCLLLKFILDRLALVHLVPLDYLVDLFVHLGHFEQVGLGGLGLQELDVVQQLGEVHAGEDHLVVVRVIG